jgi:hypothetical protein
MLSCLCAFFVRRSAIIKSAEREKESKEKELKDLNRK